MAQDSTPSQASQIPVWPAIGQIGGGVEGFGSRIKDFEFLTVRGEQDIARAPLVVTGSSDGTISVWTLDSVSSLGRPQPSVHVSDASNGITGKHGDRMTSGEVPGLGQLLGRYETGNRITCLKAFVLAETTVCGDVAGPMPSDSIKTNGSAEIMSDGNSDSA